MQTISAAQAGAALRRDTLGCSLSTLVRHQELTGPGFALYRKTHDGRETSQVHTPPSARGLLVGIALSGGHRRRIFEGRTSTLYDFAPDSCYVRPFCDTYRADMESGFDFILLELSQCALDRTFAELGLPQSEGLSCTPGQNDPVLAHLARAVLPALADPEEASPLFLDQVAVAMQTHLATRYHGVVPRPERSRGLSPRELDLAREMLASGIDGDVLVGDVAAACGMSRSHFIRGFKAATGATPHQWLLRQKVERARDLLLNSRLTLADVAAACGFSDQSHMTRTFTRLTGAAPGAWRRRQ